MSRRKLFKGRFLSSGAKAVWLDLQGLPTGLNLPNSSSGKQSLGSSMLSNETGVEFLMATGTRIFFNKKPFNKKCQADFLEILRKKLRNS